MARSTFADLAERLEKDKIDAIVKSQNPKITPRNKKSVWKRERMIWCNHALDAGIPRSRIQI